MLKFTQLSKICALFIGLLFGVNGYAQVGIGTTTPAAGSVLDITSTNKGVLVPRVDIAVMTTITPVTGGAPDGLLVWNTRAATGIGYHYWSVATGRWIPLLPATAITNDWSILGNNNIVNGTNFLGTTNNQNLDFRTSNNLRMRIYGANPGQITVNSAAAPFTGDQFTVYGTSAVNGYTTNGVGIYGQATSGDAVDGLATSGVGVYGQTNTGIGVYGLAGGNGDAAWGIATSGDGVYGQTTSSNGVWGQATTGMGVRGQSTSNRGVLGISASQAGVQGNSTSYAGVVGLGGTFGTLGDVTGGVGAQGQATTGDGVRGFTTSGNGVYGQTASLNGVWGQATSGMGVRGQSTSNRGVLGISTNQPGVQGQSTTSIGVVGIGGIIGTSGIVTTGVGAQGEATSGIGVGGLSVSGDGVVGESTSGNGVFGLTNSNAVSGGRFTNSDALGHGLLAAGNGQLPTVIGASGAGATATGSTIGFFGVANGGAGDGIIGVGNGIPGFYTAPGGSGVVANSTNIGVYAYTTTTVSDGVLAEGGTATGSAGVIGFGDIGVAGIAASPAGYGLIAIGDSDATGVKYFHIDHPLDPSNKYLNHASIESNEILNLYRGTEIFDGNGRAIVTMPNYYDAININASYQLTAIGGAMPNLYIEKEITNGQFIIAGGIAGKKVSWQLTAERNDPYLQKYPEKRIMEIDKGEKRGTYLMPELFGKSKEQSYFYRAKPGTIAKTNGTGIFHQTSKSEINSLKLTTAEGVKTEKVLESKENKSLEIERADATIELKKSKKSDETTDSEVVTKKIKTVESSTSEKE